MFSKKNKEPELTDAEVARINKKFEAQFDKAYIVTDSCFWKKNPSKDYNISDPNRLPHAIELVDMVSGTVVYLPSGSVIKVISAGDLK